MARRIDFEQVRRRLIDGEGGYEVVHTSPGLELGVYVLVAPERGHAESWLAGMRTLATVLDLPAR